MKIAILGFGKEGKSTYNWLLNKGYEKENIDILDKSISNNYLENLDKYDIIYKTPGISIYLPELQKVKNKIKTQADILFENFNGKIILVSGSKGKSTTSTLIYEILKNFGKKVKLVGNIGNPILSELDFNSLPDYIVFEISSYMLDSTKKIWSTYSILTNIYEVHTSWHKTHENYINSKFKLFENIKDFGIVSIELKKYFKNIENIKYFGENTDYYFDENYIYSPKYKFLIKDLKLEGNHNYKNICSILPIFENENIDQEDINMVLKDFSGLEHRQELVGEFDGIKYYNDSIATIPESVLQALNRFGKDIGTIILGGKNDNFDYLELIEKVNKLNIENIIFLPDSFFGLEKKFNGNIFNVKNMTQAVKTAKEITKRGKICILSPGAPSYNLFKNFEERGNLFKKNILGK